VSRNTLIIGAVGSVVAVCLVCGACLLFTALVPPPSRTSPVISEIDATEIPSTIQRAPKLTDTPQPTFTRTNTPKPTDTPLPTSKPTNTPKPTPTFSLAADKSTYKSIDVRDLQKSPEKYRGQKIVLPGEIFRIQEAGTSTAMQIWVSYPGAPTFDRVAVVVHYQGTLPGAYEKQNVTVYGIGAGTFEGTNAFGGTISQPLVNAQYVDYTK
jgi:hypothetical protein